MPSLRLLALTLVAVVGCASYPRNVIAPSGAMAPVTATRGRDREVLVVPFEEARERRKTCGASMDTRRLYDVQLITCAEAPTLWTTREVANGFAASGFRVLREVGAAVRPPIVVRGRL